MSTFPYSPSRSSLMAGVDEDTAMAEQNVHSSSCITSYGGASFCGVDEDTVMTECLRGLKRTSSSLETGSCHGNKAQRRTKELLPAAPSSNPFARRYPSTVLEDTHARLLIEFYGPETILSTLLAFDDELDLNFDDDEEEEEDDGYDDMHVC